MTQERWQRLTEWPLAVVAVIFLVAYSWDIIGHLTGPAAIAAESVINATWVIFVVDYLVRLILARPRHRWFVTHLLDLAVVVLPMLRGLRLLRLLTLLSVLNRTAGRFFRGRVIIYAAGGAALLVYVAALAVLDAERDAGSITSFGDAMWWPFVTITTVGYGDFMPVTASGRLVAVAVMIGGIALIGVVTATLASWIVEKVSDADRIEQETTRSELDLLNANVLALTTLLEEARSTRSRKANTIPN